MSSLRYSAVGGDGVAKVQLMTSYPRYLDLALLSPLLSIDGLSKALV